MAKLSLFVVLLCFSSPLLVSSNDGPLYDSSAYTECKVQPENPLYDGGMLKDKEPVNSSSFLLNNLNQGTRYCFSIWIKTYDVDSALITASLVTEDTELSCIGTVIAKKGCWSFLKGGFVLSSPSNLATLYIQNSESRNVSIEIASASLQPFTEQQWRSNQEIKINEARKRAVNVHILDKQGQLLQGVQIRVEMIRKDFPFGSAIARSIIGNSNYQRWFAERFNVAVFENELKWYSTEIFKGQVNYTIPDKMLEFTRSNKITVRGHAIFWDNPIFVQYWAQNLTAPDLELAVNSRIQSLMNKYKGEFVHWDVNNEMLHYKFYEERLGPNAALQFFKTVHQADPLAILFMNEFNVVELCQDTNSTVDAFISRIKELQRGGVSIVGIGLQGHFGVPNPPLMRGIIDKLATLHLPIWLTEVDISMKFSKETQASYLEDVLREGFSHPAVDGIVMWTAMTNGSCDRMCLTDKDFNNLPTGDVVDKLLQEWDTKVLNGLTDEHGLYSFVGSLGEYKVIAAHENKTIDAMFSVPRGRETKHIYIQL